MTQAREYALLSAGAYSDIRPLLDNQAPTPPGWIELTQYAISRSGGNASFIRSGLSARVYRGPGGEVVISLAGTEFAFSAGVAVDFLEGNLPLAVGKASAQAYEAALLYQKVKAEQGPNITFTGHSLGGGLAGVMAVWFNQPAYVFAPAPFQKSADSTQATTLPDIFYLNYALPNVRLKLGANIDPALANYDPATDFPIREGNVQAWAVNGEILEAVLGAFDWIEASRTKLLNHPETQLGALSKHSIDLHAAALLSATFDEWAAKLPSVLPLIFDDKLYGFNPLRNSRDFLIKLNRNEVGVEGVSPNGMLTHFANDLQKLGTNIVGLNRAAQDALVAQGIEWYYWQTTDYAGQEFFVDNTSQPGLLQYNLAEGAGLPVAQNKATRYISKWLAPIANEHNEFYSAHLAGFSQWTVSIDDTNSIGTARDASKDQIFIGGAGADAFTGGNFSDVIFAGIGNDTLDGGGGSDKLYGGAGDDTYTFTGSFGDDSIVDSDGLGSVVVDSLQVTGASAKKVAEGVYSDGTWKYLVVTAGSGGNNLILQRDSSLNRITIRGWSNGQLGITLNETPDDPPSVSNTFSGDFTKKLSTSDPTLYVKNGLGNYVSDGPSPASDDVIYATAGNDRLLGGAGNDALTGWEGDDEIDGGDGDDLLFGGLGRDVISGGAGVDFIFGSGYGVVDRPTRIDDPAPVALGPEYTRGFSWVTYDAGIDSNGIRLYRLAGAYSDTLADDAGNVIDGGAGDDWIRAGSGADIVHGGDDNDNIVGLAGADVLFGDDGDDRITGDGIALAGYIETVYGQDQGNDILVGGAGNDELVGQGGDDELYGGDDNDLIFGDDADAVVTPLLYHGDDYLDGGAGDDSMVGGGGSDQLFGGVGNDLLNGDDISGNVGGAYHGEDFLDGGDGNDQLVGGGQSDTLIGGIGNDSLWGDDPSLDEQFHASDLLDGGDGDDYLEGGGGDDELIGGSGDDTLFGGVGRDALYGDDGADQLSGGDGDDALDGGEGNDTLFGGAGADEIFGGIGDDFASGEDGDDYIVAGDGADSVLGGNGNDVIIGGVGNDVLVGDAGDDQLFGDEGNDQLQGGDGADLLSGGSGDDVLIGEDGDDLLDGGQGADELQGGAGNDVLAGGDGDDTLFGQEDDDTLDGGAGNDQLVGGSGHDLAYGGDGDDQIWGDDGDDLLEGGAGDDQLQGGDGDDTLIGGAGTDYLNGGAGDDTYVFGAGDFTQLSDGSYASEFVDDNEGVNSIEFNLAPIEQIDLLSFDGSNYMEIATSGGSIYVNNLMSSAFSTISVQGTNYSASEFFGKTYIYSVDQTTYASSSALQGGKRNDTLRGYGGSSTFSGGSGNDQLYGYGGNNVYRYSLGDGDDFISDSSYSPASGTVAFGAGIAPEDIRLSYSGSTLIITFGPEKPGAVRIAGFNPNLATQHNSIQRYTFDDGTVLTHEELVARGFDIVGSEYDDTLDGTNVNDRLTGGAGNDLLRGKGGADVYTFHIGDGADVVADADISAGALDVLQFGPGITPGAVAALQEGSDAIFVIGSDLLTLKNYFAGGPDAVERIEFNDGTVWNRAEVDAAVAISAQTDWTFIGTEGNDTLRGLGGNDLLDGRGGNDILYGAAGNDTLIGGIGYDSLIGGGGSDVYVIRAGDGYNIVRELGSGDDTSTDILRFEGLASTGFSFARPGGYSADLQIVSAEVAVEVEGQFSSGNPGDQIELFQFTDRTLTAADVRANLLKPTIGSDRLFGFGTDDSISGGYGSDSVFGLGGDDTIAGDQGNDFLAGGEGNDVLEGGEGDDLVYGEAGNDTLSGGAGSDTLNGGAGDDTYLLALGTGTDIVQDDSGIDRIQVAAGLTPTDVTLFRVSSPATGSYYVADQLVIQLKGGSDQIWVENFFAAIPGPIESIVFADGTTWDYSAIVSRLTTQGGTVNTMTGTNKSNTFVVDHWNDVVNDSSLTDQDLVNASVSYMLPSNVENLTLTGTLNLSAYGNAGVNTLRGNSGNNTFTFSTATGADIFFGSAGDDTYLFQPEDRNVGPDEDPNYRGGAVINELPGEGLDTMVTGWWSAALPQNVENLVLSTPNHIATFYVPVASTFRNYTHRYIGNDLANVIDTQILQANVPQQWLTFAAFGSVKGLLDFRLDGGLGADTMIGGLYSDTYVISQIDDLIIETGGASSWADTVETPFETALIQYPNIENITLIGNQAVGATGDAGANRLDGSMNSASNVLQGGAGDDTYVIDLSDQVIEETGFGWDTVVIAAGSGTARLDNYANVETLRLGRDVGSLDIEGTGGADVLIGSGQSNTIWGGDGDDTIEDQFLEDITYSDKYGANYVSAFSDADVLYGGSGADLIKSRGGADKIDPGSGDDRVVLGVSSPREVEIVWGVGSGHDIVTQEGATPASLTIQVTGTMTDTPLAVRRVDDTTELSAADGSTLLVPTANPIVLNYTDGVVLTALEIEAMARTSDREAPTSSGDFLIGTVGQDAMVGLGGDDGLYGLAGDDLIDGGEGNDRVFGASGNDTIVGGAGNDLLVGGAGADVYRFGAGFGRDVIDEIYLSDDTVSLDDAATDVIEFDATVAVADVAVYRQVRGTVASGLVLSLLSTGDSVDVQHAYATGASGQVESVRFSTGVTWDLATQKSKISGEVGYDDSNDTLTAPVASGSYLSGRGGDDTLTGGSGNDVLDGGTGIDSMSGGAGNDTYYVDMSIDTIVEAARKGTDLVLSSADSYTLPSEVENLTLIAGSVGRAAYGNSLANVLRGNELANTLDGQAGSDTMIGGLGDDTYVVDSASDVVVEEDGQGLDTVNSGVSYTLGANVENLLLTGTASISGTGNTLGNRLIGNSSSNALSGGGGNDWLDGSYGADSMTGGAGDDTYVVDDAGDKTVESAGQGSDTVQSSVTWTLATEVERLFLTGSTAINGTGNALSNWLIGNAGSNTLDGASGSDVLVGGAGADTLQDLSGGNAFDGGAGDDTLRGGAGNDLLAGGTGTDNLTLGGGSDVITFNRGDGSDTLTAPAAGAGAGELNDTISVGKASWSELALSRESNDLVLKLTGLGDSLRIKDWYLGGANRTVTRLQWIVDSTSQYAPGGGDPLRNSRVSVLDFVGLVSRFDAAKAANPSLINWQPLDADLSAVHIGGSDISAYGGSFAYRYAQDGTIAGVALDASADLGAPGFGSTMQSIVGSGEVGGGVLTQAGTLDTSEENLIDAPVESAESASLLSVEALEPGNAGSPEAFDTAYSESAPASTEGLVAFLALPDAMRSSQTPPTEQWMLASVAMDMPVMSGASLPSWTTGTHAASGVWLNSSDMTERLDSLQVKESVDGLAASSSSLTSTEVPELASRISAQNDWAGDAAQQGDAVPKHLPRGSDLFPVSSLLQSVALNDHVASDRKSGLPAARNVGDVRSQWKSIDAWTAIQDGLIAQVAGGETHEQAIELGLNASPAVEAATGSLRAHAQRLESVTGFKLAQLA